MEHAELNAPWIDIHCHCLPGVDDGPRTVEDALRLCLELVANGVGQVIATPHQLGRYEGRNVAADIRRSVLALQSELDRQSIPLRVHAGGEVRIDPGISTLIQRDQILTLADRKQHVLVELPHDIAVNPQRLLSQLGSQKMSAVIAHVERYPSVIRNPEQVLAWMQAGAALQVNAGSLLGESGSACEAVAWELLRRGAVSLIASDAHDTARRKPCIAEVAGVLADEIGAPAARQLLRDNPERILNGEALLPVVAFVDGSTPGGLS